MFGIRTYGATCSVCGRTNAITMDEIELYVQTTLTDQPTVKTFFYVQTPEWSRLPRLWTATLQRDERVSWG